MSQGGPLRVVLVDSSLYTAPYDAALTRGLLFAGVQLRWMTRPLRPKERQEIPEGATDAFFYRRVDQGAWLPQALRPLAKGCAHLAGTLKLLWKVRRLKPDVVHFQWIVVPLVDAAAMVLIRQWCLVVLTVHDTVAYNGQKMPWLQRLGHRLPVRLAHLLITHTQSGRQTLLRHGISARRVTVIPHGPLDLGVAAAAAPAVRDPRWTVVLFGEIKPYKGLDVLIDAVAALPASVRRNLRVLVAGRPRMDIAPLVARIDALDLAKQFELRLGRLSEEEMGALFDEADGFVFPYRQVDASGVYYLVQSLGKWLIASRVGIFAEELQDGTRGALVPSEDVAALSHALEQAVAMRPAVVIPRIGRSWDDIGCDTRALYERGRAEFDSRRAPRPRILSQRRWGP